MTLSNVGFEWLLESSSSFIAFLSLALCPYAFSLLLAAVASRCAEAISRGAGLIITSPAGRGGEARFNKVLSRELNKLAIAKGAK